MENLLRYKTYIIIPKTWYIHMTSNKGGYMSHINTLQIQDHTAEAIFSDMVRLEITDPKFFHENRYSFSLRRKYTNMFSWCIVDDRLLYLLKNNIHGKAVDIIAGSGYLAKKLRELSVEIDANGPSEEKYGCDMQDFGITFRQDPVETCKDYDTVILSWPPYDNNLAFDVWQAMKPGAVMLYIGEWQGGCNANDAFFDSIEDCVTETHAITQWDGIHDQLFVIHKPE